MDAYEAAIQYFYACPDKIEEAWTDPLGHPFGYLFAFLTPSGRFGKRPDGKECGCPTLVKEPESPSRQPVLVAWTDELTQLVKDHPGVPPYFAARLPHRRAECLTAIAEIQRIADKTLNRNPPQIPYPLPTGD